MAFQSLGAVTASVLFPTQAWPAGAKAVGPTALPDQYSYGWILIDLSAVADLTAALTITVDLSVDAGQSWTPIGGWGLDLAASGYTLQAGHVVDATGTPVRITGMPLRLPQREASTRQLRLTVNLSQPCTVGMTVVIW